jgi:hypothetical protein
MDGGPQRELLRFAQAGILSQIQVAIFVDRISKPKQWTYNELTTKYHISSDKTL